MSDNIDGYLDGRDLTTPEPSSNRSAVYRHCWRIGRLEKQGRHLPADLARALAAKAEQEDAARLRTIA